MSNYKNIISRFRGKRIMVIGDVILDQHIRGSVSRISPEAPVPIVHQQGEPSFSAGGAANVAKNLKSLGARVLLMGRVGRDGEGRQLLRCLRKMGMTTQGIFVDPQTPTVLKTRVIAGHQQVLRIDRERVTDEGEDHVFKKASEFLNKHLTSVDAIILSDYGKGMITKPLVEQVCAQALKKKKILTVDPKVEHFAYYRRVTAITPNKAETENAIRNIKITQSNGRLLDIHTDRLQTDSDIDHAARQLLKFLDLESLIITLGEQGMCLMERGKEPQRINTKAKEVFDVTGAGDTVIAVFTLALTTGISKSQAADLANYAAGIVVGKMGAVAVTPTELIEATKQ
jgi:D-glycero-beta-D-manno-heptose-7-phosphate kinase